MTLESMMTKNSPVHDHMIAQTSACLLLPEWEECALRSLALIQQPRRNLLGFCTCLETSSL